MTSFNQPLCIAGLSIITSTEEAFKENSIGKLWDLFLKSQTKEQLKSVLLSDNIYAVYSHYEDGYKGKYRTTIGFSVDKNKNIPDDLTTVMLPVGKYKIYQTKNQPQDIIATWQNIWNIDPNTLHRNFIADFEEYHGGEVKIYVGHD